jgi:hypothetical protein
MDDVRFVCCIEGRQHLDADVEYVAEFESLPVQVIAQSFTVDELRCQKGQNIGLV